MEPEPILYRTEALAIIGVLGDIIVELRKISRLLANGEEEEEDSEN